MSLIQGITEKNPKGYPVVKEPTVDSYKGNPILYLPMTEDGSFPFSFGVSKARAILENLDAVKEFIRMNEGS